MARRKRKKSPQSGSLPVHERLALDLPYNAEVVVREVEDPYALSQPGREPAKLRTLASIRDDPLGRLHARRMIDEAQYHAGRMWQRDYEASGIGLVQSLDTTKEPVSGGRFPDPVTDRQRQAGNRIAAAARLLGQEGESLTRRVLGERMFVADVAAALGMSGKHQLEYFGRRFRECLDTLAVFYRLAAGPRSIAHRLPNENGQ